VKGLWCESDPVCMAAWSAVHPSLATGLGFSVVNSIGANRVKLARGDGEADSLHT
jgi:hypothetical protein